MRWDLLPLLVSNTTYQKSLLLVVSSERAIESECKRGALVSEERASLPRIGLLVFSQIVVPLPNYFGIRFI